MTDIELKKLAAMIVEQQSTNKEWMQAYVAERIRQEQGIENNTNLVSASKAAEILGISVGHLRRIKEHLHYVKGGSQSSPLKFDADKLKDDYLNYIESTKHQAHFGEPIMRKAQ